MLPAAVAFDLDDTLLRSDSTISDYTVSVLRKLHQLGVHIIPASGRAHDSMKGFVKRIGISSCSISCNGAEIWSADHKLLRQLTLPCDLMKAIASFCIDKHVCVQTYDGPCFYYSEKGHWADDYAQASMLQGVFTPELKGVLDTPRTKMLAISDPEEIAQMYAEAQKLFGDACSVTCSKPYFLEFNPLQATKGVALQYVADVLHFSIDDAFAFGDSLNDLSMLQAAGRGIAMANARSDVKSLVSYTCASNDEDGVARYLEQLMSAEESE